MRKRLWFATLLLWSAAAVPAVPDAQVEAVTVPAWLVRDGLRMPLTPGAHLRSGDAIATGPSARARLRLVDGSMIKLGENAKFTLPAVAYEPQRGVLRATLGVVEGAFRFTTTLLHRYRGRREIQVQFTTFTAGIRGTDLWGKSAPDREVVALIEGRIEVQRPGEQPIAMETARTWYQSPRNAPAPAVEPISDELLGRFAAETEMAPGQGTAGKAGRWRLIVLASADEAAALAAHDRLREAGYPAALQPLEQAGRYRVQIGGFDSAAEAGAVGARLRAELDFDQTEVMRR